ncbi:unnamed protein product [Linum trigynum]|uniref:Uncharacterized protein n=1 Tax=Linum trigynum TaxID=586398 RepID=A0AAV2FA22_9ROSI
MEASLMDVSSFVVAPNEIIHVVEGKEKRVTRGNVKNLRFRKNVIEGEQTHHEGGGGGDDVGGRLMDVVINTTTGPVDGK